MTAPQGSAGWSAPLGGTAVLASDYDEHDQLMLRLYTLGKQRQWDADTRLDWDSPVDPDNPLGMPDSFVWIAGSALWDRLPESEHTVLRRHTAGWTYSQLLHSEQFGLLSVSKIAQMVPDLDSKLFAATQLIDEARHTEVFNRYLHRKIGILYPLTGSLSGLFDDIVRDSRWDISALGVQILVENMAMAIFTMQRDSSSTPLVRALAGYIMQDEARHVAFGRVLLRRHYRELSSAERRDREEFVVESCWSLREGFVGEAMWNTLDYGSAECIAIAKASPALRQYRRRLFMRVVPALRDVGLLGPTVRDALEKMGVLGFARLDDDSISAVGDEAVADLDRRERIARQTEIEQTAALGGTVADPAATLAADPSLGSGRPPHQHDDERDHPPARPIPEYR
ncbi:MAG TPA: ferritin-like domain-containing protein [Actinocrinis sp.]|nr:ferritin-like domain-containing protein [Actinocrinis sp.]